MRSAQSVVVRNAMPPLGDTDGAGGSDAAGEAPHSVAVLPVISEPVERDQLHSNLSTTLRPLVERERRERGDEDGAVGVAGRGTAASSTTRRRRMTRSVTVILGPRPMSHREEVTLCAFATRFNCGRRCTRRWDGATTRAGQARVVRASTCYMYMFAPRG